MCLHVYKMFAGVFCFLVKSRKEQRKRCKQKICGGGELGLRVRSFVGIVKKQLLHHLTQEQEDRAAEVLRCYRDKLAAKCSSEIRDVLTGLERCS